MLSRGDGGRRRAGWLSLLLLLLAAAVMVSVWRPWHDAGPGAGSPHAPTGAAHCPPADLTGVEAGTAAFWRTLVEPVHRAACAGDFTALARLMGGGHPSDFDTEECNGCSSSAIVTMWREEYHVDPAALARLLETRPVDDQGGLVYVHGDLAAVFARGTHDIPAVWSGLYLHCHESSLCAMLASPPAQP